MAPEQCLHGPIRNEKIDIYALGQLIYHLVTQSIIVKIFKGTESDYFRRRKERIKKVHDFLLDDDPFIRAMSKAVVACFTEDPTLRPNAQEVVDILLGVSSESK